MAFDLKRELARRPGWMNALFAFCLFMTIVYMPYDFLIKPVERDEEVWFGLLLHGWAAKLTEPLHWAIYAAGAFGFWRMKRWMWPWAAVYTAQVAIGMLVWTMLDERGLGLWAGLVPFAAFGALAVALLRARERFSG